LINSRAAPAIRRPKTSIPPSFSVGTETTAGVSVGVIPGVLIAVFVGVGVLV
jgi:hypothetical protein